MLRIHLRQSGFTAQWFASIVYRPFDKKSSSFNTSATRQNKFKGGAAKSEVMPNRELAEELHKPITRKFGKKVYSFLKSDIWAAGLADMQLMSRFNTIPFFYYVLLMNIVILRGLSL